ncbi:MAG: hypothetical protein NXI27_00685 [Alphaproteobacteria bacterium]|nr:hypothetical protein [Alphaproteobacteria bacterium]
MTQTFPRVLLTLLLTIGFAFQGFAQSSSTSSDSGQADAASGSLAGDWPRAFETADGATVTMHQPQVTKWQNFTKMTALIASEYRAKGSEDPAFGVIEVSAATSADRETDEVVLSDISVINVNFSTLTRKQLSDAALKVGSLLPTAPITVSLTRMSASLSDYERLQDTKGLSTDAPSIWVSEKPALLLQTNGKPTTAPIKGTSGLEFVINTNWDLIVTSDPTTYYLRDEKSWLSATTLKGPWAVADTLPDAFSQIPKDDSWKQAHEAMPPQPIVGGAVPVVYYSDKPAELIVIDGQPQLEAVPDTALQWVSNANTDVFFDTTDKEWYFLTSGRWFKTGDLQGSWRFASDSLPGDFQRIPDGQPYSIVRASVPGTSESDEARLQAAIPTTAQVDRKTVTVDVTYYGDPKFERIKGTDLQYAVNTSFTVILVGNQYFVIYNGVWFVGSTPTGPFVVADSVPDDIYSIPPTSPVYNVTYVRVYSSTPEYVVYGYTAGYLWGYLAWNTYVYGTGWYYPPYWVYRPGFPPVYRPWRVTYGSGTYYLPGRGTFNAHWGRAYGPYGGIAAGGIYNENTGAYIRGGAAYGPYNSGGFISVQGPAGNQFRAAIINGNVYHSWNGKGVTKTNNWARSRTQTTNRWKSKTDKTRLRDTSRQKSDLFANRDGHVYRKENGNWQQHEKGKWRPTESTSKGQSLRQTLDRSQAARQRGNQRIESRQESIRTNRSRPQRPSTQRFERRRR